MIIFGTKMHTRWREYPIACLFDILCKIEIWEPAYWIWSGVWIWLKHG